MRFLLLVSTLFLMAIGAVAEEDISEAYKLMRLGNFTQAATVFLQAGERGDVEGRYQLGKLYLAGRGVEKSTEQAHRWLGMAADADHSGAQYTLGLSLVHGGNFSAGKSWLMRAAEKGHERAAAALEELSSRQSQAGNTEAVRRPGSLDSDAWFPAVLRCDDLKIKALVKSGVSVSLQDEYGRSALYYMVACENTAGVELLLSAKADIDSLDRFGESVSILAVRLDLSGILKILIEGGADTSQISKSRNSLLHIAIGNGQRQTAQLLIDGGAPLNIINDDGHTPLDLSVIKDQPTLQQLLRKAGAKHSPTWHTEVDPNLELITQYLAGSDAEADDPNYFVRLAVLQNNAELLDALLTRNGSRLLAEGASGGVGLLMQAVEASSHKAVPVLIAHGALVDGVDAGGKTALMRAATAGDEAMVSLFLDSGASTAIQDARGRDVLHLALAQGQSSMARKLIPKMDDANTRTNVGRTYLMLAIEGQSVGVFEELLHWGVRPPLKDDNGRNALAYAMRYCNKKAIALLLSAQDTLGDRDINGLTPLHIAANVGCDYGVIRLLGAGVSADVKTGEKNTPIMLAIRNGHTQVATRFLEFGVSVDEQNISGDTALHFAISTESKSLISQLLALGSDPYRRNFLGKSAMALAQQEHPSIVALLKEKGGFHFPGL